MKAIIVHGGAWDIPATLHAQHLEGCRAATEAGWAVLMGNGSALDAVEAAVRVLEDDPVFDAGLGSHLNADGIVELDAGIMDGATLRAGAVGCVKRVANPVTLARHILEDSPHVLLTGDGAEQFARFVGLPLCDPEDLVVPREREQWERKRREVEPQTLGVEFGSSLETVGAIALDNRGNLAVANSTGGTLYKHPGRIGDTPIIGCGFYADNSQGAAACTGWGEQIMKTVLAKTTTDQIALRGNARDAAQVALAYFRHRIGGLGGLICISPSGQIGFAHSTPYLAHGYRNDAMSDIKVALVADAQP